MNNTPENVLIAKAKKGDELAFEKLVAKYKSLVVSVSRKYFLMGGNQEDLLQEGMVGLFKAVKSFDSAKNDNFASYVRLLVERQIINAIKSSVYTKSNPLNDYLALNNQGGVESSDEETYFVLKTDDQTPEMMVESTDNNKQLFSEIEKLLSDFEMKVLHHYLEGASYSDIAQVLGTNSKSVDNALNRIKSKLKVLKTN